MSRSDANTKPPDDFDELSHLLWHRFQRQARRQGTWRITDESLLEQLVRNIVLARESRQAATAEPFVTGSRGQKVAHPALKIADSAEAAVLRYATALLLTPEARARHEIKPKEKPEDVPWLSAVA